MNKITKQQFLKAIYPKENNRFAIAMIVGIPVALISIIYVLATFGLILILVLFVWFAMMIAKMNLIGNSVKVSKNNFPEIHSIYQEVKSQLSYDKEISIYIVEEGTVNALLAKFFKTKFIVLNSELVKGMVDYNQMKWIIARFIGALKAKHFKTTILRLIFENVENLKIFNFFVLPYERATQYTGDNIGLLATNNVEQSINAFNRFMVGNGLSDKINFEGIIEQGIELHSKSFFSFLARAFSSHPHLIDRYLNLLAYAKKEFPSQFNEYMKNYNSETIRKINLLIPNY